jgi:uncharacterized protein
MPFHFLIIHGTRGSPQGNWFPWLAKELGTYGTVSVPAFPTPEGQSLENWVKIAEADLAKQHSAHTIIIGHSIGAACALRLAEKSANPTKALFLICPFLRELNLPDYDPLNASFIQHAFDWRRVKAGTGKIICFAGDGDPYVPLSYAQEVADKTGAVLNLVKKGGHLNTESGYSQFPLLLQTIRQDIGL